MPFPDDYYTVKDSSTATGRRVNLTDAAHARRTSDNTPIAAAPYNLNDGFSPGQVITLRVPGLDTPEAFAKTNPIPLNDLSRNESQDSKEPIVVIDADDQQASPDLGRARLERDVAASTALLIHGGDPVRGRPPLHRRDAQAQGLGGQQALRAGGLPLLPRRPALERGCDHRASRKRFENIFRSLRKAKIKRHNLYLAWDFTVASDENIAGRLLHMRDDAFAQLGDTNLADGVVQGDAPAFSIDSVVEDPNPGQIAAPDHGHVHGALLPDQQLRGAGGHRPGRERQPDPARHLRGELRLHHPRRGDRVSRPPVALRPRPARAVPARSTRARSAAWRRRTTSSSAPPTRSGSPRRTSRTRSGSSRTWAASPSSPTALQQGLLERALPRAADGQPERLRQQRRVPRGRRHAGEPAGDRHVEAVLQRQQPGRHPRRRADRGLARTSPGRRSASRRWATRPC